MAEALYNRMKSDPPRLTNGKMLDEHLALVTTLSPDQSKVAMDEYLRFLAMAATGPSMAVPSPLIDAVWHKHIEDTRAYQDYCLKIIGRFVHHIPNLAHQREHEGYPRTLDSYSIVFGTEPDTRIWPTSKMLNRNKKNSLMAIFGLILSILGWIFVFLASYEGLVFAGLALALAGGIGLIFFLYEMRNRPWLAREKSDSGCTAATWVSPGGDSDSGCGGGGD